MPKQVLLLQKNPARPDVMPLANGNDVFTIASLMGQFLPPPPSLGDYISSMRTLNKHTEPPFCNFLQWILPCDSYMPPILSAPILSAPTCHIYQQTMHPSANLPKTILIYPYPTPAYLPMTKPASYFYVLFIATSLLDHIFLPPSFIFTFLC